MAENLRVTNSMIPLFNRENYEFWSIKMKVLLKSEGLWDLVETGAHASDPTPTETAMRDAIALLFLQQALYDSVFVKIAVVETSKEAWTILKTAFQRSSKVFAVKLQDLRRKVETLSMNQDESAQAFDEVVGSQQTHEARLFRAEEKNDEKMFLLKRETCPSRGKERTGIVGNQQQLKKKSEEGQASFVEEHDNQVRLFLAKIDEKSDFVFLDKEGSDHMMGLKNLFDELDESTAQLDMMETHKDLEEFMVMLEMGKNSAMKDAEEISKVIDMAHEAKEISSAKLTGTRAEESSVKSKFSDGFYFRWSRENAEISKVKEDFEQAENKYANMNKQIADVITKELKRSLCGTVT